MTLATIGHPGFDPAQVGGRVGSRGIKGPVSSVVSAPTNAGFFGGGLYSSYQALGYMMPWEILDYVELLAEYNADYSQAASNVRTLANSGHDIFVDAPSTLQQRKVTQLIDQKSVTIQQRFGGIDGLIDKLLKQATTFGAMCGEWIVDDQLAEVVDFYDINPKDVRFFWNNDLERYQPFQKLRGMQFQIAQERGQLIVNGCVALNEFTFHYYAFNSAPGSPYGVPPFLAALEPIATQRDMFINMSQIVKKMGLLGIVDVIIKQLPFKAGETPEQYVARAESYLDQHVDAVEDMLANGGMVHFDDIEVKNYNITGNAAGATNLFKQNEEQVFSGLKSMPSIQGRSYSTTETYAGVAYDIVIRNTLSYQRACKRIIEAGYYLMAAFAGLNPDKIKLTFRPNKTLHRLQDAQAEAIELHNGLVKWAAGYIDQHQAAQEAGYNSVDRDFTEPPTSTILGNAAAVASSSSGDGSGDKPVGGGKPDASNRGVEPEDDFDERDEEVS